eukprot:CAMPEP_0185781078 /NCGR_PEP_ID=MMETSP1174-20130828/101187_1 /TAXON_ID=35687 /ORGANISM="Dictyocha speculum, Strain CCMP1381" /LENGTH=170 /DNA_ID=CAMNT_0028470923 /DNA_START=30 /DNA_END=544 /DNA_ORIENTATION=-
MAVAANAGFTWLDAQLASDGRSFLCGDRFTIADIRLYVNYKFLTGVHKKLGAVGAEHAVLMEYIARIAAKDSAKFIVPPPRPKKLRDLGTRAPYVTDYDSALAVLDVMSGGVQELWMKTAGETGMAHDAETMRCPWDGRGARMEVQIKFSLMMVDGETEGKLSEAKVQLR